jgi:DnaA family protein
MAQVKTYGPEVLSGLSQLQLVCIDDVDEVLPDSQWEIALFNFINACRQSGTLILFSTSAPVSELQVHLADLKSRLSWGAVFEVKQLGDEDKMTWLKTYALNQGLVLQDDVAQYLMSRQQRDMHALVSLIQSLDYASMSEKRKLTLPFVKSVIGC